MLILEYETEIYRVYLNKSLAIQIPGELKCACTKHSFSTNIIYFLKFWISANVWTLNSIKHKADVMMRYKKASWFLKSPSLVYPSIGRWKLNLQTLYTQVVLIVPCTCLHCFTCCCVYWVRHDAHFLYLPFGSTARRLASISFVLFASSSLSSTENSFWKLKTATGL